MVVKKKRNKKAKITNQQGFPSRGMKFIDPPDGVKMSAVILKLADPLLKKYGGNDKQIESIISLTVIEWNKSMFPEDEQEKLQDITIDRLVPKGGNAEDVGSLLYISDLIVERKKKYFPDLRKVILGYDLSVANGNITLNVSSVPIEPSVKHNTANPLRT